MIKVFNPNFSSRIEKFFEKQYFMHLVGFKLTAIEEGRTEGVLDLKQEHLQQAGMVHGGVTASLADVVAGFAAYTAVPSDCNVVTGELKISYFNPGIGQKLHAIGTVIKQGKKINFCEAEIWCINNEQRTLIAKASTSMVTIFPGDVPVNKN